jgi:hypothetical protein
MAKQARKPFEVKPKGRTFDDLADELANDITEGLAARSASELDVAYWHTLYEQGRTRNRNTTVADAADLTSHIGTEKVDALRARLVKTVMSAEPVYTVEGWGEAEKKAPFVEEFHQWQLEMEGFQSAFSRAVHLALIEPMGVLEVYEDTIRRPVRKTIRAALELAPDGSAIVGEDMQPQLQQNPQTRKYVETDENTPSAEVEIDDYEVVARGPRHRTVAYRDFLVLPGHAREKADVWGYGKRFFRRVDELKERVEAGLYDKDAVESLGTDDEHASETTLAGEPLGVTAKSTDRAEKELWELLFLKDLGEGLRWYVATLYKDTPTLLRLQYDDIGRPRYFPFIPFPRPHRYEGYSVIGHKLITSIEEHTAWRNMDADRGAMQLQMPMQRVQGALWDPDEQPIGAKAVIDVRQIGEIVPLDIPDMTGSAEERISRCERAAERLIGVTDVAAGVTQTEKRTLGEVNATLEQSFVRIDEAKANINETLEEIGQVRHIMWKRALAEMGAEGLEAPPSVQQSLMLRGALQGPGAPMEQAPPDLHSPLSLIGLEVRQPDVAPTMPNLRFTAEMMEGVFRFKPKGSVETADKNKLRVDFNQSLQAIGGLAATNPMIAAILQTPSAAKALLEQWVRLYHVNDKQAFLGSEAMQAMQQAMMMRQAMGTPPGAPTQGPQPPQGAPPA